MSRKKSLFCEVIDEIIDILTSPFRRKRKDKRKVSSKKSTKSEDINVLKKAIEESQGTIELGQEETNIVKTWLKDD
ncbi:hypothetical protein [Clostridium senegalense]|uniref:Uncharacterized protein n=1 Tax=Clostridium senegalense TaxID=1465809 RepID=A0A6M0H493_9CLOT|nr:hypothetical protein [Clostridium senegalense]NEU04903.1 hypothetical protein [Clostridium senegalense]